MRTEPNELLTGRYYYKPNFWGSFVLYVEYEKTFFAAGEYFHNLKYRRATLSDVLALSDFEKPKK